MSSINLEFFCIYSFREMRSYSQDIGTGNSVQLQREPIYLIMCLQEIFWTIWTPFFSIPMQDRHFRVKFENIFHPNVTVLMTVLELYICSTLFLIFNLQ